MDDVSSKSPVQDHHAVPRELFDKQKLLQHLEVAGKLNRDEVGNRINAPVEDDLSKKVGFGPHRGSHPAYTAGVRQIIEELTQSLDGQAALAGNGPATERVVRAFP